MTNTSEKRPWETPTHTRFGLSDITTGTGATPNTGEGSGTKYSFDDESNIASYAPGTPGPS